MKKTLVTSYYGPDLDGVACSFAYAEFLKNNNTPAVVGVFETPRAEARFVLDRFHVEAPMDAKKLLSKDPDIILVDASDRRGISKAIDPLRVTEIIDHRKIHRAHEFPNAKLQIEPVGAAATLVAERFFTADQAPTKTSAALLYAAIISNTVNFQAGVTTDRDRKAADKLQEIADIPPDLIHDMFVYKSSFEKDLDKLYFAEFLLQEKRLGIAQCEMVGVEEFHQNELPQIRERFDTEKEKRGFDFVFMTCIDVEKGFNQFVAFNESQRLLTEKLGVTFSNNIARRDGIIMRKEIVEILGAS